MATTQHLTLPRRWLTGGIIGAVLIPWSVSEARPVHEQLAVDPQGPIEIVDVAGSVALSGWDRPEIEVTGTAGDEVDRVEVTTSGGVNCTSLISSGSEPLFSNSKVCCHSSSTPRVPKSNTLS